MNTLINFINSHDGCRVCRVLPDNRLEVASLCTQGGRVFSEFATIPATWRDARDWLGY